MSCLNDIHEPTGVLRDVIVVFVISKLVDVRSVFIGVIGRGKMPRNGAPPIDRQGGKSRRMDEHVRSVRILSRSFATQTEAGDGFGRVLQDLFRNARFGGGEARNMERFELPGEQGKVARLQKSCFRCFFAFSEL